MFKAIWISALFAGTFGIAAEHTVDLSNIGLRLGSAAERSLAAFGKKLDKSNKLVAGSVEITSLTAKDEELRQIHVEFSLEKSETGKKAKYLHCEGDLIPEEGESDPSDVTLKLKNAGCES